jgi:GntR family transcriptional regulator/MocR family aminotransferase
VHKAKYVADWHSSTLAQGALARFIDDGGFARHVRKVGRAYAERRALITRILTRDFAAELAILPSFAGLHLTTVTRTASLERMDQLFTCAAARGMQLQRLAKFYFEQPKRAGLLFGYGAISTAQIQDAFVALRSCFD